MNLIFIVDKQGKQRKNKQTAFNFLNELENYTSVYKYIFAFKELNQIMNQCFFLSSNKII